MILRAFSSLALLVLLALATVSACSSGRSSCDERHAEGASLIQAALSSPSSTQCATDTDCVLASAATPCVASCGSVPISKAGATALGAAVAQAAALCDTGCAEPLPPCPDITEFAICANEACIGSSVPPTGWVSLSVEHASGAGVEVPATCAAGASCTLWTLTPDAALVVNASGVTHHATLSAADFQTVDGIVRTLAFRQNVAGNPAWSCDAAPPGPTVSLDLTYTTATLGSDVTGCVEAGPAGNGPQTIFQVLSAY